MNQQKFQSPPSHPQKQHAGSPSKQASGSSRDDAPRDEGGVAEQARALGSQAKEMATDVAGQVAQSAERQFAGGKDRAAEAITQIAGALRQTGDKLLAQEMPVAHDYLGRVATQVEGVSSYLQTKQLGDVVGDLESFARREPVLFMGGAFVVGLLGGRFLKSSRSATASPATEGPGTRR